MQKRQRSFLALILVVSFLISACSVEAQEVEKENRYSVTVQSSEGPTPISVEWIEQDSGVRVTVNWTNDGDNVLDSVIIGPERLRVPVWTSENLTEGARWYYGIPAHFLGFSALSHGVDEEFVIEFFVAESVILEEGGVVASITGYNPRSPSQVVIRVDFSK